MFRKPDLSTVFADNVTAWEKCRLFMSVLVAAVDIAKRLFAADAVFVRIVVDKGDVGVLVVPKSIDEERRSSLKGREEVFGHDGVWCLQELAQCFGLIICK